MKKLLLFILLLFIFKINRAQDTLSVNDINILVSKIDSSHDLTVTKVERVTHLYASDTMILNREFFYTDSKQLKKASETVRYYIGDNSPAVYDYMVATYYYDRKRPIKAIIVRTNEIGNIRKQTIFYYLKKKVLVIGDKVDSSAKFSARNLLNIFNKEYK